MLLYHGSTDIVNKPLLLPVQRLLDFGQGFYTTSNKEQAIRWAAVKQKRSRQSNAKAFINIYEIEDIAALDNTLQLQIFENASEAWLDFIVANRTGSIQHTFDIVCGPVANDTLFNVLTLFETGLLTKPETIVRLKTHQLFDQISFHTNTALYYLRFVEAVEQKIG
jgi:hypothetical protein